MVSVLIIGATRGLGPSFDSEPKDFSPRDPMAGIISISPNSA